MACMSGLTQLHLSVVCKVTGVGNIKSGHPHRHLSQLLMRVASNAGFVAGLTAVACVASVGLFTALRVATACVYLGLSRLVMSFKSCSCRCLAIIHVTFCYQYQLCSELTTQCQPRMKA